MNLKKINVFLLILLLASFPMKAFGYDKYCFHDSDGFEQCEGFGKMLTGLSDVGTATVVAGRMLISDGTKFQSVAMSGSCTLASNGAISCPAASGATNLTGLADVGSATISAGRLLIADGTKFQTVGMSGSCTITSAGVISCTDNGATYLTGLADVGSATIAAGTLLIADGTKFQSKSISGDVTVTSAGVTAIGSDKVGATQLSSLGTAGTYPAATVTVDADGRIINAFGSSLTGLSDIGSATITAGNILIQDGTKFQSKTISGDITVTSAGVTAIGSDKVGSTQLSSTAVTAGTYGAASLTVDADGRVINAFSTGLTGLNDVGSSTVGAGRLLINDGTKFQSLTVTGDVTITSAGVTSVGADKIGSSQLSSTTVTAGTYGANGLTIDSDGRIINAFALGLTGLNDVGSSTVGAGRLLINDGTKYQSVVLSGSCTVTSAGVITCTGGSGATFLTGLADVGSATIAAGTLLIADGTKYQSKSTSGDVTINSAGATAIGSDKVGATQLSSTSVTAGTYGATGMTVDADGRIQNAFAIGLTGLNDVGSATVTAGNILIQDGTKFQSKALSQHCFVTSSGQVNCNAGGWAKSLTGLSDVGTATITAGNLLVADGTNFKSVAVSGDVFLTSSGRIASNTFAKQLTGLSDVGSSTITAGNILIQDGTKFQSKAMSGDVTMTSAGVTTSTSGLQFLGSKVLGSAAATTGALTVAAKDVIVIYIRITGYAGGGDIAALRFNADSGANYWDRHITWAAGGTTATNTQTASTTLVRLARAAATTGRMIEVTISNLSSVSKSITIYTQTGTGAAATVGVIDTGGGEWVNTSAQITSIELLTAAGGNMNANSGFAVFGKNL